MHKARWSPSAQGNDCYLKHKGNTVIKCTEVWLLSKYAKANGYQMHRGMTTIKICKGEWLSNAQRYDYYQNMQRWMVIKCTKVNYITRWPIIIKARWQSISKEWWQLNSSWMMGARLWSVCWINHYQDESMAMIIKEE